jgi:hypothetical protein
MSLILADLTHEFRRHKRLGDEAIAQLSVEDFFRRPTNDVNSVAIIVKHVAGNLASRWSDFLISDGDKPTRDRDAEFVINNSDTREHLLERWEEGWQILMNALDDLTDDDLAKTITIRQELHTVFQALIRGLSHAAYHIGQILYIVRLLRPQGPWLTIAPGQSRYHEARYREPLS